MVIKKNQTYNITITDLGNNGEGIGKLDGYTFFVEGALPTEEVEILAIKVNKSYGYGKLLKILKPSNERVAPPCPVAGRCGGCSFQHLSYGAQLEHKTDKVRQCLMRIGGFRDMSKIDFKPAIGMQIPYGYRNKAQYPIAVENRKIKLGFYAKRSHRIIENPSCIIGSKNDAHILEIIRKFIDDNNISVYNETSGKGLIRHILIRTGYYTGEIMVCLVANSNSFKYSSELIAALNKEKNVSSVVINFNTSKTNVILGEKCQTIFGNGYITDFIGDLKFKISPLSFFQVNPLQTRVLYSKVLEFAELTGDEIVVDAYCGIGTISLFLAQKAKMVYGIEIVPQAIENANENKKLNNITNAEFFTGKSEEIFPQLVKSGVKPSLIVVDPPRKGCDRTLLDTMLAISPEKIVYVSCDPATLARDLKILCENGYKPAKVQPVDMFPHSTHVETVVQLSQQKPNDKIHIDLDLDDADLTSAESKATYSEIKDYIAKNHNVKVSDLYIAQVKGKYGITERENYNLPKSDNTKTPLCPKEKEEVIAEALKHFGMM